MNEVGVKTLLGKLSHRERAIIKLRWGVDDGYTYTLEEVGKIFKVTRERVRSVERKAYARLVVAEVSRQDVLTARLAEVTEEIQELEVVRRRLQKQI